MQQTQYNFNNAFDKLINKRFTSINEQDEFLSWDLKQLPDLTDLLDLEKTAERIILAINNEEKIGVYGDYDVDGTTSCALFFHFFKMLGVEVYLVQPSRFTEGYGIHPSSIKDAKEKEIKLLITVDCGITNDLAADKALEENIDLIITDHHKDILKQRPKAYSIVNPNRSDETCFKHLKDLAGVGVAFAVCLKIKLLLEGKYNKKIPSLYELLQFVAIGTICDMANLNSMNLKLVRHGLKQLPKTNYSGLKVFLTKEEQLLPFISSEKLSFLIGPIINSKGRLDHPKEALELLISDNFDKALEIFSKLKCCNDDRKIIQSIVYKEARKQLLDDIKSNRNLSAAILYKEGWHEGVIGIVASKIVEEFKIPALIFTNSKEDFVIKASVRSAGDLNIFNLLKGCEKFFIKFGGHKAAAGLSMKKENYRDFKNTFLGLVSDIPLIERTVESSFDIEINPQDITVDFIKKLDLLEPYGMGNPKPIFKIVNTLLDSFDLMKDVHVRWNFSSTNNPPRKVKGISFNYIGKFDMIHPSEIHSLQFKNDRDLIVYATLGINRFKGNEYIQLMIQRIEI